MAIHRRPGDVPRSTVIDVEQPGVREDEPPGCSLPLNVVDELLGGTLSVAWCKLHGYVEYERERAGLEKNWEWFQWLAEHIDRHSKARTSLAVGAHEAYRDGRR